MSSSASDGVTSNEDLETATNAAVVINTSNKFQAGFWNVLFLGLSLKYGGLFNSWHNGLVAGVWGYFVATLIIAMGYAILTVSVAEIMSIISFPGGHFAYVRASLGPFWGYTAGFMGLMESMFFLAVSMLKFGQGITATFKTAREYEFLWWLVGYLAMMGLHLRSGRVFWYFMALLTIITSIAIGIYLIGTIPQINFDKYAYENSSTGFVNDPLSFFLALRLPGWFYIGIDLMSQTSEEVKNPMEVIPKAMLIVMGIMFCLSLWLELTVAGQKPGLIDSFFGLASVFPLAHGYSAIFNSNRTLCSAFGILPAFTSCTGYMYCSARQVNAMARSGLLPKIFTISMTFGAGEVPIAGMVLTSVVGLIGLCFAWFYDPYTMLFRTSVQGGCIAYILVLISFIVFRISYRQMERKFTSPIGISGAVVGIIIFVVVEVSLLFLLPIKNGSSPSSFGATIAFFIFWICITAYYFLYVERHQSFSPQEQKYFLKAYVVNANIMQRKRAHHAAKTKYNRNLSLRYVEEGSPLAGSPCNSQYSKSVQYSRRTAANEREAVAGTSNSKVCPIEEKTDEFEKQASMSQKTKATVSTGSVRQSDRIGSN